MLATLKGNIDPNAPPTAEKENVFVRATSNDQSGSPSLDRDHDDKGASAYVGETSDFDDDSSIAHADPFEPFDDLPDERKRIITIRAVLLGAICGALVGSSNIYLGLKLRRLIHIGWRFESRCSSRRPPNWFDWLHVRFRFSSLSSRLIQ